MTTVNLRKLANAFYPDATSAKFVPADVLWAINRFKRKHGGLWVGGTVAVSQQRYCQ